MKKVVILILFVLSITLPLMLTSCGKTISDPSIFGKWERDGQLYSFNKNGTMTINSVRYSYKVKDGVLSIFGNGKTKAFAYSILDDSLFIAANEYKRFIEPKKDNSEIADYIEKFFS